MIALCRHRLAFAEQVRRPESLHTRRGPRDWGNRSPKVGIHVQYTLSPTREAHVQEAAAQRGVQALAAGAPFRLEPQHRAKPHL